MINRTVLVGRLTRDPELKFTPNGIATTTFTLACDRPKRRDAEGEPKTDFIRCVAWRQSAEFITSYGSKGRVVGVDGRVQVNQWTDNDEKRHTMTEVLAERVQLLDPRPEGTSASSSPNTTPSEAPSNEAFENGTNTFEPDDNDMPF